MGRKWTDEEIQFLKFAYPNKDFKIEDIANAIDRSYHGVRQKAKKCKLERFKEEFHSGYKRCNICKTLLPYECFHKHKEGKYGLRPACKECTKDTNFLKDTNLLKNKKCSSCGKVKSINLFWKSKKHKDGYNGRCIECIQKKNKTSKIERLKERGW